MVKENLDSVIEDLLSISPIIRRITRQKVFKTAFARIEEDISLPHFEIMKTLYETGTLHIAQIGDKLQIPKPQMTRLIDKLVRLEIVVRELDTDDRRNINVSLTDKGKRIMKEHRTLIWDVLKDELSCLTDDELLELSASLRRLRDILAKL